MLSNRWWFVGATLIGTTLVSLGAVASLLATVPTAEPVVRAILNPLYSINRNYPVGFVATLPIVTAVMSWYGSGRVAVASVFGTVFGGLLAVYLPQVTCCEGTFLLFRFQSIGDVTAAGGMVLFMFVAAVVITATLSVPVALLFAVYDPPELKKHIS